MVGVELRVVRIPVDVSFDDGIVIVASIALATEPVSLIVSATLA